MISLKRKYLLYNLILYMAPNKIYIRFLATYLLLISLPLIAGIFMSGTLVNEYEDNVKRSYIAHLSKTRDVMDSFIDDIKWSTYKIAANAKLTRLINDYDWDRENLRIEWSGLLKDLIDDLNRSLLYNSSFNSTFYVYLKDQDLILTPYSVYKHSDFDDAKTFFRMDAISSADWHALITGNYFSGKVFPSRSVIIEDFINKNMVPYVQSVPISLSERTEEVEAVIVYLIGESDIQKLMNSANFPDGGLSLIANETGEIISSIGDSSLIERDGGLKPNELSGEGMIDGRVRDRKVFIVYTSSAKYSWKYISILPENILLERVHFFQLIAIIAMFLTLAVSVGLASYISYRSAMPLTETIKSIKKYLGSDDTRGISYSNLTTTVSNLINKSSDLQLQADRQSGFMKEAFINRLLNGFFKSEEDIKKFSNYLGLKLYENRYCAALVSLWGYEYLSSAAIYDELTKTKILLKTVLTNVFPYQLLIVDQDDTDFAVIILSSASTAEEYERVLIDSFNKFFREISNFYTTGMSVCLGSTVNSLLAVHGSYLQARETLEICPEPDKPEILQFKDIEQKLENYYFPIDLENRIIIAVLAGDVNQFNEAFTNLYSENIEKRGINREKQNKLLGELSGTLAKLKNRAPEYIFKRIDYRISENDFSMEDYREVFKKICLLIEENKKSHNNQLIKRIQRFIEQKYADFDLGLFMVANEFSITESYLSYFFKEQTGQNFSTFIERIRIDKSTELLKNTDLAINIVAKSVGYGNDKTFRRVFRKTKGLSPSEFRQDFYSDNDIEY